MVESCVREIDSVLLVIISVLAIEDNDEIVLLTTACVVSLDLPLLKLTVSFVVVRSFV